MLNVWPGEGVFRAELDRIARDLLSRGSSNAINVIEIATLHGEYSERALKIATEMWRQQMRHEHQSAAVFSRLVPQLMAANASVSAKMVALRSSMDELHHALLCAHVVRMLSGDKNIESGVEVDGEAETRALPSHKDVSPRVCVMRNLIFVGCMNETVAVALLGEERQMTREPSIRCVNDQIFADEVLHAKLGWGYLSETLPTTSDEEKAQVEAYLPSAFRYLEQEMIGRSRHIRFEESLSDELAALGCTSPQHIREIFEASIHDVIIPQLAELGFGAQKAWDSRSGVTDLHPCS